MNSESLETSLAQNSTPKGFLRRLLTFSYPKMLVLLFVLSLPITNPWLHGDGVGYYAYVHSLLFDHDLQFEDEWRAGNASFVMSRVDTNGVVVAGEYTATHHIGNNFAVGASILWAPFLAIVHVAILSLNHLGANITADGFSRPYLLTMALSTAGYGFLGLFLSFQLARLYTAEKWAFLGTVGYWFASSLPVYMYLNPSWSHAQSLFSVALFLWYWHRTRGARNWRQWAMLGLLAALMGNVYYPNLILLLVPGCEAVVEYAATLKGPLASSNGAARLFGRHVLSAIVFAIGMLPTLITRKIIYGGYFTSGYAGTSTWHWTHPVLGSVLFSSNHGLLSWTPILVLAVMGIAMLWRLDRAFAFYLWAAGLTFYYVIASYVDWHGMSSFGSRFFVSLGSVFIIGLAVCFERFSRAWKNERRAFMSLALAVFLFVVWNFGFIFQWGDHLIPVRGPISWRAMTYNQFCVVPVEVWDSARAYLFSRNRFLRRIEQRDIQEIQKENPTFPNP